MIYLDHNATTPIDERVLDAMLPFLTTFYGNPSSLYRPGRVVRSALETARGQVASLVGVQPAQVIFTSGGTEANNLALAAGNPDAGLAISAIEHPSIAEPAQRMNSQGRELAIIAVDADGLITQEAIDAIIRRKPGLASFMLANNETGVIQDVAAYARQLRAHRILVHTDAVQALGKIPVDFNQLGVHLMSLSSHKIYGPKGCGALVFEKGVEINALLLGGGQEQDLRAGTENVAAIIGFGKAAELARVELAERGQRLLALREQLEESLMTIPGLTIFARQAQRLPNTVQFGIDGLDGEMLLMKLDQKNVAVSSGSACASGAREPSAVLTAMGVEPELARSAIRVSLGQANTAADISKFIELLKSLL
ncbi:MAG: cysteine desulfurase [Methylobacter sp.]|uniref:cysteine desulfurase family protein n=1 Tax=Methylobacter sp. TaxID=2051955 RepID=UPI00258FFE6D|nr:cysteine desulfurase family protein [Methylobacter sp.]MCL7421026.1 cysteine desulfurase [Methylobacter sp.]